MTDGSKPVDVLFTAGNAITVTPGFNTQPGVTSELKIAGCFSNLPAAELYIPNTYLGCQYLDGQGGMYFCLSTKNITEYTFTLYTAGDATIIPITNVQVNTALTDATGYNVTCFDVPYITTEVLYYYFQGIGCNGASITEDSELFFDSDCDGLQGPASNTTSVKQNEDNTIKLYPNPFCSEISVENSGFAVGDVISLIDGSGKEVYKKGVASGTTLLDLNDLEGGVYLVKYNGANSATTQKITKACE